MLLGAPGLAILSEVDWASLGDGVCHGTTEVLFWVQANCRKSSCNEEYPKGVVEAKDQKPRFKRKAQPKAFRKKRPKDLRRYKQLVVNEFTRFKMSSLSILSIPFNKKHVPLNPLSIND